VPRGKPSLALVLVAAGCVLAAALAWRERTGAPQAAAGPQALSPRAAGFSERERRDERSEAEPTRMLALAAARHAISREEREAIFSETIVDWVARDRGASGSRADRPSPGGTADASRDADELRVAAQAWALRDFAAAYRWARGIEEATLRASVVASVLYQALALAPQDTLELAQTAPLGELREIALQNLAAQWSREDRAAAQAWAMTQPATPSRDGIFERLAVVCAQVDPAGAAHLIAFGISPGAEQEKAVVRVLEQWPDNELTQAAQWVERLPTESLRRRAEDKLRALLSAGH